LLRVHAGALADDLGHSKPAVIDALTRLHNDGHIVWDADTRTALCWFVIRNVTLPAETNRKSYLTECSVFSDSPPRREATKWIQAIEITTGKGAQSKQQSSYLSKPPSTPLSSAQQRTENREQLPIPIGIGAPAVAVDKPKRAKTLAQDPPDLQATVDYFLEQGSTEGEAHKCHDYWLSAGWRRKSGPIKDWLATCRTWIGNSPQFAPAASRYSKPAPLGKLTGQDEIFSEAEMVKARKQMAEDTTPW
jgi:hypothetical protein